MESSKIEGYESMNIDGDHIPNLIIAEKMCFDCINIWKLSESNICKSDCGIQSFNNNEVLSVAFKTKKLYRICS